MAVLAGVEASVRMHIDRGDDLDARDLNGLTPLMLAASKNKAAICALLLSHGADPGLADAAGRDAMTLARAAGASDAVAAMEPFAPKPVDLDVEPSAEAVPDTPKDNALTLADIEAVMAGLIDAAADGDDDEMIDVSGWVAEEDKPAPEADASLSEAAIAGHRAISSHIPIDDAADWEVFDGLLPEMAAPLPKPGDEASIEKIATVLRRALREGSVPDREVQLLFEGDDETEGESKQALLRGVLADLGAETDERLDGDDTDGIWLDSPGDEDEVAEALLHYEDLLAHRNDPSRHYARDLPKVGKLLTAAEEQAIARDMEEALSVAVGALAAWPEGLAQFLAAALKARPRPPESSLDADPIDDGRAEPLDNAEGGQSPEVSDDNEDGPDDDRDFQTKVEAAGVLSHFAGAGGEGEERLRAALLAAKPSPDLLAKICLSEADGGGPQSYIFKKALGRQIKAKERLVCANLRLVISLVKRFGVYTLPFDDLVQEGNLGLMKAADKFDWRRGNKFSTYATWWINQAVRRATADKPRVIRTPVHLHYQLLKMSKEPELLTMAEGRRVSRFEAAAKLSMPLSKYDELMARWDEPVPLHEPDGDGCAPVDKLADGRVGSNPYELAERSSLLTTLGRLLEHLSVKEAEQMTMRFGLNGEDPKTLEELGIHYGVTRERIRQIEAACLTRLAKPIFSDPLRSFLDGPAAEPRLMKADPGLAARLPLRRVRRNQPEADDGASRVEATEGGADSALDGNAVAPPDASDVNALQAQALVSAIDSGGSATLKVIEMAKAAGAVVVDSREEGGGVVIQLVSEESRHRVVIRRLLGAGFASFGGVEFRK